MVGIALIGPLVILRFLADVVDPGLSTALFVVWILYALAVVGLYLAAVSLPEVGKGPDGRPVLRLRFSDGKGSVPEPGGPPGDWLRLRRLPLGVRRDLTEPGRPGVVARVIGMDHEFVAGEGGRLQELYLLLNLAVRTREPRSLDIVVRLVGPDGQYLQAGSSAHRGFRDRYRYTLELPYVNGTVVHFPDLEVHVPLEGVDLPPPNPVDPLRAEVDLVVGQDTVSLARVEQRFRFPAKSSHQARGPAEPLAEGELVILAAAPVLELGPGACPVCGAELGTGEPERRCPECETPHHLACWRFAHGCSTFGCTGGHVL